MPSKKPVYPLRITGEQRRRWDQAAEKAGLSLNEWISQTVEAHLEHERGQAGVRRQDRAKVVRTAGPEALAGQPAQNVPPPAHVLSGDSHFKPDFKNLSKKGKR